MTGVGSVLRHTTFEIEYDERPFGLNKERTQHWSVKAELTSQWLQYFQAQANNIRRRNHMVTFEFAEITVHAGFKGQMQDIGNCYPAVKAAIDGVVAAKVLPDDNPRYLHRLVFERPEQGRDFLKLTVKGWWHEGPT